MKYMIIGGGGFIGSNLCDLLLDRGHRVHCVDTFTTSSKKNLDNAFQNSRFRFLGTDYRFKDLKDCDGVFILAGSVGNRYVDENPQFSIENNISLTKKIFTDAEHLALKVMYFSTSEVYGDRSTPMSEDMELHIGNPTKLRWGYACSKLMNEFYALSHNFPCIIIRPFNISGKRQVDTYGMVIPSMIRKAISNEPIEVYGTGKQIRCFCHIDDAVIAFYRLMLDKNIYQDIFNVGNPSNMISIDELAREVIRVVGCQHHIRHVEYGKTFSKNYADIDIRIPSIQKIYEKIGWTPEKGIEDIIRDVYSNFHN
jgi:UDP-glucose 4-epimerase